MISILPEKGRDKLFSGMLKSPHVFTQHYIKNEISSTALRNPDAGVRLR